MQRCTLRVQHPAPAALRALLALLAPLAPLADTAKRILKIVEHEATHGVVPNPDHFRLAAEGPERPRDPFDE